MIHWYQMRTGFRVHLSHDLYFFSFVLWSMAFLVVDCELLYILLLCVAFLVRVMYLIWKNVHAFLASRFLGLLHMYDSKVSRSMLWQVSDVGAVSSAIILLMKKIDQWWLLPNCRITYEKKLQARQITNFHQDEVGNTN